MKDALSRLNARRKSQFFELYILHMLNDGYYSSFFLLLPFLVKDFNISLTEAGLLGTLVNVISIFFAIPAGYIATKIGGLRALIIAVFVYGLAFLGTSLAPSVIWLFPFFVLAGIGFSVTHPIGFALVTKLAAKEHRGKYLGNFTASGDIGRIGLVAIFTFIIAGIGWRSTTTLYAAVALAVAATLFLFFLPRAEHFASKHKNQTPVRFIDIITHKRFLLANAASFFDTFAGSSLFFFLPFLLLHRGIEPALLGSFTAVFFFGTLFGKTVLGRIADKFGAIKVFIISEILMAAFILLLANATSFVIIILCSIILGIFTKGTVPVLSSIIAETGEHHGNFEKLFGINATTASMGATIAPLLLGFISDKAGIVTAFGIMAIFSLFAIVPMFVFAFTKGHTETSQS